MFFNVTVKMFDELGEKMVERTIDGGNLMVPNTKAANGWECDCIGTKEQQEKNLTDWIDQRANAQHETILTLVEWTYERNGEVTKYKSDE